MLNQTECDCVFSKAFESYWVSACRWSAVALVIILTRYCASCVTCERQISVTFPVERGEKDTSNFKSIRELLICEITFCLLKVLCKNYLLVLFKEFQPHLQYINSADIKEPFVFCCDKN